MNSRLPWPFFSQAALQVHRIDPHRTYSFAAMAHARFNRDFFDLAAGMKADDGHEGVDAEAADQKKREHPSPAVGSNKPTPAAKRAATSTDDDGFVLPPTDSRPGSSDAPQALGLQGSPVIPVILVIVARFHCFLQGFGYDRFPGGLVILVILGGSLVLPREEGSGMTGMTTSGGKLS
jgi:hypothetical protein